MSTVDDELLERIRAAYAPEALRVPVVEIKRATSRRPVRRLVAAATGAVVIAVAAALTVAVAWPRPTVDAAAMAAEQCARAVLDATRGAASLPVDERGQVPATRLDLTVGANPVFLYATRHTLVTCVHRTSDPAVAIWTAPAGETLPPNKLQPLAWGGDDSVSWVSGTLPAETQRVTVELPSGRRVPAASNGEVFIAAWAGETGRPRRIEVLTTSGTSVTWGPGN